LLNSSPHNEAQLVTATSCMVSIDGGKPKKVLAAIDCNRETKGFTFGKKPMRADILFSTEIDFIDCTVENTGYGAPISLSGLGFGYDDIRVFLDPTLGRYTLRFGLPKPASGKLTISTKGGTGSITLYDISGFTHKETKNDL